MSDERRGMLEAEVQRMEKLLVVLERDRRRIPYLGLAALLAVPAGLVWGVPAAGLVVLATLALIATSTYLIKVRIAEDGWYLRDAQEQLARMDASPALPGQPEEAAPALPGKLVLQHRT